MTKASGQKTRPEVAKKGVAQAPDIYDFVQSPEWQKVLEKARIEQERSSVERDEKSKKSETSETSNRSDAQSTTGEQSSVALKTWPVRLEEARKKRNAVIAGRTGESEVPGPDVPDGGRKTDLSEKAGETFRSQRHETSPADPERTDAELSLRLSNEEIDYRLSAKVLQKLEDQRRSQRKVRVGLIAIGCTMGVIASSTVFWVLSGPESQELVGSVTAEVDATSPLQEEGEVPLQADLSTIAPGEKFISTDLVDTFSRPISSDGSLAEAEDPSNLVVLTPPVSNLTEATQTSEMTTASAAPSILAYVPALEQPFLPLGGPGYLPSREANPSFLPYEIAPEFLESAITLAAATATGIDPVGIAADAFTPPMRSPKFVAHPVLFKQPAPLPPAVKPALLPVQVQAVQPDLPLSIDPIEIVLTTAVLVPSAPINDPVIDPEALQPPTFTPRPEPPVAVELAALPGDDVQPPVASSGAEGAEFRLYAPNTLPQDAVDSVVADLTGTGHELNATARVGFRVSQSNVRFYHRQDAAKAADLAEDAGALLRDFTGANTKTPRGVVELYLAGKGYRSSPVRRATKRNSRSAAASNPVDQLRSQVLKKLRATTN